MNKELREAAWQYVLVHNRIYPDDPRFVAENGVISTSPCCVVADGFIAHRGHGPGLPCKKFLDNRRPIAS